MSVLFFFDLRWNQNILSQIWWTFILFIIAKFDRFEKKNQIRQKFYEINQVNFDKVFTNNVQKFYRFKKIHP